MAIIISAWSCTGKTYVTNQMKDSDTKIYDLSPDEFTHIERFMTEEELEHERLKWIKTPHLLSWEGHYNQLKNEKIRVPNLNFATDYLNRIKKLIPDYDIIFIDSDIRIRTLLETENIPFYTIYPGNTESLKNEYIGRFCQKLMDSPLNLNDSIIKIARFRCKWNEQIPTIEAEPHGTLYKIMNGEYIASELLNKIIEKGDYYDR